MKIRMVMIVLLAVPGISFSSPELKGSADELSSYLLDNRKIVVITGEGKEKIEADKAIVSLIVKTKEDRFQSALKKNKKIRENMRKELTAKNISADNITFAKFASTPEYGWFGDKPTSYTINNEVKVTIKSEDELEAIAAIVDKNNEVYFVRTVLEHTGKEQSEAKALDKSLEAILAKKSTYETKLGLKLKVVRILEESVYEDRPVLSRAPVKQKSFAVSSEYMAPSGARSSSFGEITYRASTRVEFISVN